MSNLSLASYIGSVVLHIIPEVLRFDYTHLGDMWIITTASSSGNGSARPRTARGPTTSSAAKSPAHVLRYDLSHFAYCMSS